MDLAQEIANLKRKAPDAPDASSAAPRKKYMTKGELERQRQLEEAAEEAKKEEEKQKQREEKIALAAKLARDPKAKKVRLAILPRPQVELLVTDFSPLAAQSLLAFPPSASTSKSQSPDPTSAALDEAAATLDDSTATDLIASSSKPEVFNISPAEAVRRLRQKGQPIRLFGEDDKDRRLRLRALELMEERGGAQGGQLNDFKKALEDMQAGMDEKEQAKKGKAVESSNPNKATIGQGMGMGEGGVLDLGLLKTDPDKLYPLIYYALKVRLDALLARTPTEGRRTRFVTRSEHSRTGSRRLRKGQVRPSSTHVAHSTID